MTTTHEALKAIRVLVQAGSALATITQDDQSPSPEALAAAEAMDAATAEGCRMD